MKHRKRLIIAGVGHSHLHTLCRLDELTHQGHEVIVVSPGSFAYSGLFPSVLNDRRSAGEASVDFRDMIKSHGGEFIPEEILEINSAQSIVTTTTGRSIEYDFLSLALGSVIRTDTLEMPDNEFTRDHVFPVKPLANIARGKAMLASLQGNGPVRCTFVGGGAAGVELALNLANSSIDARITLCAGAGLLPEFPARARTLAAKKLERSGVRVITGARVVTVAKDAVILSDGMEIDSSVVFLSTGCVVPAAVLGSGLLLSPDGRVVVDQFLRAQSADNVFSAGDTAYFSPSPLPRVGVYAVRQAPVLFQNLRAVLFGEQGVVPFIPQTKYFLAINTGDGKAVARHGDRTYAGRWVAILKRKLDLGFMRKLRKQVQGIHRG